MSRKKGLIHPAERAALTAEIIRRFSPLPDRFMESRLYPSIMDAARDGNWPTVGRQLDEIREGVDR